MKIPISRTPDGLEILLTDDHAASIEQLLPAVTVGRGPQARSLKKADQIATMAGAMDAASLVIYWLEQGPERSKEARALAMRFLNDTP